VSVATLPSPQPLAPALTPPSSVLRALADVGEVDLVKGLGPRRLAEVLRRGDDAELAPARGRAWPRLLWLLVAALGLLGLLLR
jgi:uncharacterized protein with von Willebrand factor type A (vWA) domain